MKKKKNNWDIKNLTTDLKKDLHLKNSTQPLALFNRDKKSGMSEST